MKTTVKRLIALLSAVVIPFSVLVLGGAANANKNKVIELNIYNAEEYISEFNEDWGTIDIIQEFEKEMKKEGLNVKVNYSTFGTLENMYNELQLTKKKGKDGKYTYAYDLVCPSDYMIQRMINEDMLETYDVDFDDNGDVVYDKIDNFNEYASGFIKDLFNSKNEQDYVTKETKKWSEYAVCYMWGTMGFVYNPVKLAETNKNINKNAILDENGEVKLSGEELENALNVNTWHLPWEAYYKNLGTIKDSIRDTYALAVGNVYGDQLIKLRKMWEDGELTQSEYQSVLIKVFNNVNSKFSDEFAKISGLSSDKYAKVCNIFPDSDKKTVDKVSETLKVLKHNVFGFEVDSGKKDMAAGKIAINFAWSGDAAYTLETADEMKGATLYYSVPKEGSNIWFDAWVMPKGANKELAQKFVNFISSPDCAISNMDYIGYVSPIAGDEVFDRLLETYELTTDEAEANELGYVPIDYSYYFTNISDEYKTEDGKVIVYSSTDNLGRQLTTQYPEKSTVDRCAIMTTLSKGELKDINKMWNDVKVGDIPVWLLILIPSLIGVVALFFLVFAILKKHGITFMRKPKYYGKLIKSEEI